MTRRFLAWLVLLICLAFYFGALSLLAHLTPHDTGEDVAELALAGILRGAV